MNSERQILSRLLEGIYNDEPVEHDVDLDEKTYTVGDKQYWKRKGVCYCWTEADGRKECSEEEYMQAISGGSGSSPKPTEPKEDKAKSDPKPETSEKLKKVNFQKNVDDISNRYGIDPKDVEEVFVGDHGYEYFYKGDETKSLGFYNDKTGKFSAPEAVPTFSGASKSTSKTDNKFKKPEPSKQVSNKLTIPENGRLPMESVFGKDERDMITKLASDSFGGKYNFKFSQPSYSHLGNTYTGCSIQLQQGYSNFLDIYINTADNKGNLLKKPEIRFVDGRGRYGVNEQSTEALNTVVRKMKEIFDSKVNYTEPKQDKAKQEPKPQPFSSKSTPKQNNEHFRELITSVGVQGRRDALRDAKDGTTIYIDGNSYVKKIGSYIKNHNVRDRKNVDDMSLLINKTIRDGKKDSIKVESANM